MKRYLTSIVVARDNVPAACFAGRKESLYWIHERWDEKESKPLPKAYEDLHELARTLDMNIPRGAEIDGLRVYLIEGDKVTKCAHFYTVAYMRTVVERREFLF